MDNPLATIVGPVSSSRVIRRRRQRVVASCPAMLTALYQLARASRHDAPVLLVGERGTGKKTLARLVHESGSGQDRAVVIVPSVLLETASGDAWFREAAGGTLVVDAVDPLSDGAQARLIGALSHSPWRYGGGRPHEGVRVVATASEAGTARRLELFFHAVGCVVRVPPLRERRGDLAPLVEELLARMPVGGGGPRIEASAWSVLNEYTFPGNVAELAWVLEEAILANGGAAVEATDLPGHVAMGLGIAS